MKVWLTCIHEEVLTLNMRAARGGSHSTDSSALRDPRQRKLERMFTTIL